MRDFRRTASTLMELTVAIGMFGILTVTVLCVYNWYIHSSHGSFTRSKIRAGLAQAMESASQKLVQAQSIDDLTESSITFTTPSGNGNSIYRLYLYHAQDDQPNPPYSQNTYEFRMAKDDVDYGDGVVLSSNIAQPLTPVFAMADRVINIQLTASQGDQHVTMSTKIRPRNL